MGLKGNVFSPGNIFLVIFLAIILLFVWSKFTESQACSLADIDNSAHGCEQPGDTYTLYSMPSDLELQSTSLWVIKFIIIGVAVFLAFSIIMKLNGGRITRRDVLTMILLGVAVYFAWEYLIVKFNLFGATSFDDLGWHTAAKLGLLK